MERSHKKTLRTLDASHVFLQERINETLLKFKDISPTFLVPSGLKSVFQEHWRLLSDLMDQLESNSLEHRAVLVSAGSRLEADTVEVEVGRVRRALSIVYNEFRMEDTPRSPTPQQSRSGNSSPSSVLSGPSIISLRRDLRLKLVKELADSEFRDQQNLLDKRTMVLQSQMVGVKRKQRISALTAQLRVKEASKGLILPPRLPPVSDGILSGPLVSGTLSDRVPAVSESGAPTRTGPLPSPVLPVLDISSSDFVHCNTVPSVTDLGHLSSGVQWSPSVAGGTASSITSELRPSTSLSASRRPPPSRRPRWRTSQPLTANCHRDCRCP